MLLKKIVLYIIPVSVAGYFLGILFWPFMLEAPFRNLKAIFTAMSLHPLAMNQLFEGKLFLSHTLPWYYTVKYIWISYPSVVLTGILLFCTLILKFRKQFNSLWVFAICFPFIFTIFWMMVF